MSRVFDCFCFFDEFDMALTRMHILRDVVNYHVIVEAHETHSGHRKSLNFKDNRHLFKEFERKIIYVYVPELSDGTRGSWQREAYQRSQISRGLLEANAQPDDLVIVSDCDEIINPQVIPLVRTAASCQADVYYFRLNYKAKTQPWGINCCRYSIQPDPCGIKTAAGFPEDKQKFERGGWHFTYFYDTPEQVVSKISAFMHHDFADKDTRLRDIDFTRRSMIEGIDLFKDILQRDIGLERVELEPTLPKYILDHLPEYQHWIAP
jgi:beta-1,4-mannosyl-glycoprotein beta-1,4-N-acetylglucosaminyltransferase